MGKLTNLANAIKAKLETVKGRYGSTGELGRWHDEHRHDHGDREHEHESHGTGGHGTGGKGHHGHQVNHEANIPHSKRFH